MAGRPVPFGAAAPAGSLGLHLRDYRAGHGRFTERYQHLVDHYFVQDLVAGRAQPFGESPGVPAGPFDQFRQAAAPQRSQRGPQFHAARAPRHFRRVVGWLAQFSRTEVGRRNRHGGPHCSRVPHNRDSAVVTDVRPLVAIGRPGIRQVESFGEVAIPRGCAPPTVRTRHLRGPTRRPRGPAGKSPPPDRTRRCSHCPPGCKRWSDHRGPAYGRLASFPAHPPARGSRASGRAPTGRAPSTGTRGPRRRRLPSVRGAPNRPSFSTSQPHRSSSA